MSEMISRDSITEAPKLLKQYILVSSVKYLTTACNIIPNVITQILDTFITNTYFVTHKLFQEIFINYISENLRNYIGYMMDDLSKL